MPKCEFKEVRGKRGRDRRCKNPVKEGEMYCGIHRTKVALKDCQAGRGAYAGRVAPVEQEGEVDYLKKELAQAERQLKEGKKELDEAYTRSNTHERNAAWRQTAIDKLKLEVRELEAKLAECLSRRAAGDGDDSEDEDEVEDLKKELEEAKADLRKANDGLYAEKANARVHKSNADLRQQRIAFLETDMKIAVNERDALQQKLSDAVIANEALVLKLRECKDAIRAAPPGSDEAKAARADHSEISAQLQAAQAESERLLNQLAKVNAQHATEMNQLTNQKGALEAQLAEVQRSLKTLNTEKLGIEARLTACEAIAQNAAPSSEQAARAYAAKDKYVDELAANQQKYNTAIAQAQETEAALNRCAASLVKAQQELVDFKGATRSNMQTLQEELDDCRKKYTAEKKQLGDELRDALARLRSAADPKQARDEVQTLEAQLAALRKDRDAEVQRIKEEYESRLLLQQAGTTNDLAAAQQEFYTLEAKLAESERELKENQSALAQALATAAAAGNTQAAIQVVRAVEKDVKESKQVLAQNQNALAAAEAVVQQVAVAQPPARPAVEESSDVKDRPARSIDELKGKLGLINVGKKPKAEGKKKEPSAINRQPDLSDFQQATPSGPEMNGVIKSLVAEFGTFDPEELQLVRNVRKDGWTKQHLETLASLPQDDARRSRRRTLYWGLWGSTNRAFVLWETDDDKFQHNRLRLRFDSRAAELVWAGKTYPEKGLNTTSQVLTAMFPDRYKPTGLMPSRSRSVSRQSSTHLRSARR